MEKAMRTNNANGAKKEKFTARKFFELLGLAMFYSFKR